MLERLHFIKNYPDAIPYITSYYNKYWGFCVSREKYNFINNYYKDTDTFKINISSSLKKKGNLHYAELLIKGKSKKEILISTYVCHPSMANNELSGPLLSIALAKYYLRKKKLDKSIRFLFIPETIGSISYIHHNIRKLKILFWD